MIWKICWILSIFSNLNSGFVASIYSIYTVTVTVFLSISMWMETVDLFVPIVFLSMETVVVSLETVVVNVLKVMEIEHRLDQIVSVLRGTVVVGDCLHDL